MTERITKSLLLDPGLEIALDKIDGRIYECIPINAMTIMNNAAANLKRYLAVTKTNIIELARHPFKVRYATILEVHSLENLARLKFKRGEQVTFYFKNDKVINYKMVESAECVEFMRTQMSKIGIKGNQSSLRVKHSNRYDDIFHKIEEIEKKFALQPSHELVEEVMELLRQAAENLVDPNDVRYAKVLKLTQSFLQRDDVIRTLDTKREEIIKEKEVNLHTKPSLLLPQKKILVPPEMEREIFDNLQRSFQFSLKDDHFEEELGELEERTIQSPTPFTNDSRKSEEVEAAISLGEQMAYELGSQLMNWSDEFDQLFLENSNIENNTITQIDEINNFDNNDIDNNIVI